MDKKFDLNSKYLLLSIFFFAVFSIIFILSQSEDVSAACGGWICCSSTYRCYEDSDCSTGTPISCGAGNVCSGGSCVSAPSCTSGYVCCDGGTAKCWQQSNCNLGPPVSCTGGTVCDSGSCVAPPPSCTAEWICCDGNHRCYQDSDCNTGTPVACSAGQECNGGSCVNIPPPPPSCTAQWICCSSTSRCYQDSDCNTGTPVSCTGGTVCDSGSCVAPPPSCTAEWICCDGNHRCYQDSDCNTGSPIACAAGESCSSGSCVASPPPPSCSGAGTSCGTDSDCCSGYCNAFSCVDISCTPTGNPSGYTLALDATCLVGEYANHPDECAAGLYFDSTENTCQTCFAPALGCTSPQVCDETNPIHTCIAGCTSDNDCPDTAAGNGLQYRNICHEGTCKNAFVDLGWPTSEAIVCDDGNDIVDQAGDRDRSFCSLQYYNNYPNKVGAGKCVPKTGGNRQVHAGSSLVSENIDGTTYSNLRAYEGSGGYECINAIGSINGGNNKGITDDVYEETAIRYAYGQNYNVRITVSNDAQSGTSSTGGNFYDPSSTITYVIVDATDPACLSGTTRQYSHASGGCYVEGPHSVYTDPNQIWCDCASYSLSTCGTIICTDSRIIYVPNPSPSDLFPHDPVDPPPYWPDLVAVVAKSDLRPNVASTVET